MNVQFFNKPLIVIFTLLLLLLGLPCISGAVTTTWHPGTGNWSDVSNWDTGNVPDINDDVIIDNTPATDSIVNLNVSTTIKSLVIGVGDQLLQQNARNLTIAGNATNNGTWKINSTGSYTGMVFNGDQTLSGTGEIILSDKATNQISTTSYGQTITQKADHTIRGAGQLLLNRGNMVNQGKIIAEGTAALTIDPYASFINNGTLEAKGSGGLILGTGLFKNNTSIDVKDGSKLVVAGAKISGGTLNTAGTGQINVKNSSTFDAVTLSKGSRAVQANGQTSTIENDLVSNGTWKINSTGSYTNMVFNGDQTLSGTGEIILSDKATNRIYTTSYGQTITQKADHTIRGAGQLLFNRGNMVNQGKIIAEGTAALTIDPYASFINNGTLEAKGSGGLILGTGLFKNNTTIDVKDKSKLVVAGAKISGGTLNIAGTGQMNVKNSSTFDAVTLSKGSRAVQVNRHYTTIENDLVNNGTWKINSTGGYTGMIFNGDQTLSGTGQIILSDKATNQIYTANYGQTITQKADHTIRGAGQLLSNSGNMINQGKIIAEGTAALTIDPRSSFINNGTLEAKGSGGLTLGSGVFENNTSIDVKDGSKLDVLGATISGGPLNTTGNVQVNVYNGSTISDATLTTTGTTQLNLKSGSSTFDAVTLTNGIQTIQENNQYTTIKNNLVNNGTWKMNSTGNYTRMLFNGDQTLSGTGQIILSDKVTNLISMASYGQTITQEADHTIRGAGQLLSNRGNMVNQGKIIAEGTAALTIDPHTSFINNGTLEAKGSGGLRLGSGLFKNNTSIDIKDGSKLDVLGATISGGPLNTTGNVQLNVHSSSTISNATLTTTGTTQLNLKSGSSTFDAVTLTSGIQTIQENNQSTAIKNNLVNNGTWKMNSTGNYTRMLFNGDQTLSGTGQIILSDKVTNLISMASYGQTITQEADHTIRGAGQLLSNRGNMVNQGKIIAEGTAALTIDPHANLGFENQGLVSAQGTGGLTHIGSYLQTAGETVVNSLMTVKSNGDFLLQGGGLSGNGVLNFTTDGKGVINSQGTVNPGSSLGKLTIDGNYIQETDGELLIELAGDEQGITYDLLDISGDATLAGTLSVDLLDYTPNVGDIFTIIMAQSIGITPFDALNILDSGILFDVVYTDTDVQLIVSAVPVPSGFLLLISGLLSVTWIKRRVS